MSRARMGRLLFGLWLLAGCAERAAAQDGVAPFYKGKTITIVVASSPGGGYDLYGRMIARHIGKHIPGNPSVVVNNMPGAAQQCRSGVHLQCRAQGRHRHRRAVHGRGRRSAVRQPAAPDP